MDSKEAQEAVHVLLEQIAEGADPEFVVAANLEEQERSALSAEVRRRIDFLKKANYPQGMMLVSAAEQLDALTALLHFGLETATGDRIVDEIDGFFRD